MIEDKASDDSGMLPITTMYTRVIYCMSLIIYLIIYYNLAPPAHDPTPSHTQSYVGVQGVGFLVHSRDSDSAMRGVHGQGSGFGCNLGAGLNAVDDVNPALP